MNTGRSLHAWTSLAGAATAGLLLIATLAVTTAARRDVLLWVAVGIVGLTGLMALIAVVLRRLDGDLSVGFALMLAFLVVALGPWLFLVVWFFARGWARERTARARAEERAALAVNLHDSVLQTLTLIQKQRDSPDAVMRLSRNAERELRSSLYDSPVDGDGGELTEALVGAMAELEDRFAIRVDLVTTGSHPLDDPARAVVGAVREAVANAARHAGVEQVSVFADLSGDHILVRVRDRGRGFDPSAAVGAGQRGIRDSILGRMDRHGGQATIHSALGSGTEVELRVPA